MFSVFRVFRTHKTNQNSHDPCIYTTAFWMGQWNFELLPTRHPSFVLFVVLIDLMANHTVVHGPFDQCFSSVIDDKIREVATALSLIIPGCAIS
jgi:hypothetical protein